MHSRYFRNVKLFISKDVEKARLVFEMVEGHIFVIKWGYFRQQICRAELMTHNIS